ncbi:MAG TPA: hypothetical protein VFR02_00225, partial [bacterium]|nr:hypothetical protein [bacterium]
MVRWIQSRFEVFQLVVLGTRSFRLLFGLQVLVVALHWLPPAAGTAFLAAVPWWGWVLGWLAYLWLTTLGYAAERKGRFDFTSMNFFKSYLDFIINEGGRLLVDSESKD